MLTVDEMQKIINESPESQYKILMLTIMGTGLRVDEALGLTWNEVDLQNETLHVKQALATLGAKQIIQTPKTEKGNRFIPLPKYVVRLLTDWRTTQDTEKELLGTALIDNNYVFTSAVGTALTARNLTRYLDAATKKLGLEHVNPHALRHTYATRLLEAGVHPKVAQELLGHSTISMTMDIYSHAFQDVKHAAVSKLNDLIPVRERV